MRKKLFVGEIRPDTGLVHIIDLYKSDTLELDDPAGIVSHQWFAGTGDLSILRDEGAGKGILCRQPLNDPGFRCPGIRE